MFYIMLYPNYTTRNPSINPKETIKLKNNEEKQNGIHHIFKAHDQLQLG